MKVLIVHAHPEPQSFTAALRDQAVATLQAQGHEVQVSDLYKMNWNPVASDADFSNRENPEYLVYALEQRLGVKSQSLAPETASTATAQPSWPRTISSANTGTRRSRTRLMMFGTVSTRVETTSLLVTASPVTVSSWRRRSYAAAGCGSDERALGCVVRPVVRQF